MTTVLPATSGTVSFSPSNADLVLTAFRRIGIRSAEITNEHMISARIAMNLLQVNYANSGVNLFTVDLQTVPLIQGVTTYSVPSSTVMVLDAYIRQFSMGSAYKASPAFTTTSGSSTVKIYWPSNGLSVSNYINIVIPISVGGLILYGFYQVVSVLDTNDFTITAALNASSSVTSGGVVPYFTTSANSTTVNVYLPNHSYLSGQPFYVQVTTQVDGITLFGTYTISSVVDANNFTITSAYAASSAASAYENSGQCQLTGQNVTAQPVDRVMNSISRTDYAALPDKLVQGFPTVMWFDRLISPTLTLWQVPDGSGPYQLLYYRSSYIQDEDATLGQIPQLPYRFLEAYTADLSWFLSKEWAPAMEQQRKMDADNARALCFAEDRERVPSYLIPDFSSYYT